MTANPIERLVGLKRQEQELKDSLKQAQAEAQEYALALGKRGKLGEFAGATVTLKFVKVKAKDTAEIEDMRESLDIRQKSNERKNAEKIAELDQHISHHENQAKGARKLRDSLLEDEYTGSLKKEIEAHVAELQGEQKPQLAVKL